MKKEKKTRKIADYGALCALAFLFAYLESLVPLPIGIPGIKLGLANIVVVAVLYNMKTKDAFIVAILRVVMTGFTFGSLSAMIYSFFGVLLSFLGMYILKKTKKFHTVGVSTFGGVLHNLGQLIAASFILETQSLLYYFPVLMAAGVLTGGLIGLIVQWISPALTAALNYRNR